MARILVSFFSPVVDFEKAQPMIYYESLMSELQKCGNEIFYIISSDFLDRPWNGSNELKSDLDCEKLAAYIKSLQIDFCIVFNNSVPNVVVENLDCPLTLWHADSFDYFNDREEILVNRDRYHFVCPFADTENFLRSQIQIPESQILRVMPATCIQADLTRDLTTNVSFIGTPFISGYNFLSYLKSNPNKVKELQSLANAFRTYDSTFLNAASSLEFLTEVHKEIPAGELKAIYSSQKRTLTLALIAELGLELYGGEGWYDVALFLPWVGLAFRNKKVYSLKHNQDIYNSSRISLNISHSQATEGFPWRIMDIMASNSCLVTDRNLGIQLFAKEVDNLPTYSHPSEAYALCKKILADEPFRQDIVKKSQEVIEKNGRWKHRFELLEKKFKIKFNNSVNEEIFPVFRIEAGHFQNPGLTMETEAHRSMPERIQSRIKRLLQKRFL